MRDSLACQNLKGSRAAEKEWGIFKLPEGQTLPRNSIASHDESAFCKECMTDAISLPADAGLQTELRSAAWVFMSPCLDSQYPLYNPYSSPLYNPPYNLHFRSLDYSSYAIMSKGMALLLTFCEPSFCWHFLLRLTLCALLMDWWKNPLVLWHAACPKVLMLRLPSLLIKVCAVDFHCLKPYRCQLKMHSDLPKS